MLKNLAGLRCGPGGEEVFDLLQPLVVLDAQAANLPGSQLLESALAAARSLFGGTVAGRPHYRTPTVPAAS
jgi:hypothetical protein